MKAAGVKEPVADRGDAFADLDAYDSELEELVNTTRRQF
jgi:hypothetical protein